MKEMGNYLVSLFVSVTFLGCSSISHSIWMAACWNVSKHQLLFFSLQKKTRNFGVAAAVGVVGVVVLFFHFLFFCWRFFRRNGTASDRAWNDPMIGRANRRVRVFQYKTVGTRRTTRKWVGNRKKIGHNCLLLSCFFLAFIDRPQGPFARRLLLGFPLIWPNIFALYRLFLAEWFNYPWKWRRLVIGFLDNLRAKRKKKPYWSSFFPIILQNGEK